MTTTFLDKSRTEILMGHYATAKATALTDPGLLPKVQEYRRLASSRMQPLDRDGIKHKIPAGEYHVSRKVDGEFCVLIYRGGKACCLNPGGTVRVGLPWLEEAAKLLHHAGVHDAMIAGELYVVREDTGRPRVHDVATVARNPKSSDDLKRLRFAAFDVMTKDGSDISQPFAETWKLIQKWFGKGDLIHIVEAKQVKTIDEIQQLFEAWVEKDGAEGLVVRSDQSGTFKVKPRHTLDLAVLGFTESAEDRTGMLHDMLLGIQRPDNTLQVLGRVGGGFSDEQRRHFLSDLKDAAVDSEYAEVNGDNVAYQMVKPDWVVEVSCLDLLSSTTRGGTINRMVLDYRNNGTRGYHIVTKLPLATIISPQFVRRREDKHVRPQDCGVQQVANIVEVPLTDRDARQMTLPVSQILKREVYTKELKGQMMVRKFVMWKTNKESDNEEFPAYVMHYTDFSPNRKDALARDIRVSSSQPQLEQIWNSFKSENVKSGWNRHESPPAETKSPAHSNGHAHSHSAENGKHDKSKHEEVAAHEEKPMPKASKKVTKKAEPAHEATKSESAPESTHGTTKPPVKKAAKKAEHTEEAHQAPKKAEKKPRKTKDD